MLKTCGSHSYAYKAVSSLNSAGVYGMKINVHIEKHVGNVGQKSVAIEGGYLKRGGKA